MQNGLKCMYFMKEKNVGSKENILTKNVNIL